MTTNTSFKKRSLGHLRPAPKSKPRSPDCLGSIKITRQTMEQLLENNDGDDEIVANLAGWRNTDTDGHYLTVELSPKFQKRIETKSAEELFAMFQSKEDND